MPLIEDSANAKNATRKRGKLALFVHKQESRKLLQLKQYDTHEKQDHKTKRWYSFLNAFNPFQHTSYANLKDAQLQADDSTDDTPY